MQQDKKEILERPDPLVASPGEGATIYEGFRYKTDPFRSVEPKPIVPVSGVGHVEAFRAWIESDPDGAKVILSRKGLHKDTISRLIRGSQAPGKKLVLDLGLICPDQTQEPIFDTFDAWMGSVSDPVRSIMDALGCSYNHAIGVVRGLKVPAKRLLIALRIKENRRTLGTPPKAVLMARGGFLRKLAAEMLAELEDAGRGDSEPARAYREAVSTWDRVGDKLETDKPWRS